MSAYVSEALAAIGTLSSKVKTSGANYLCVGDPATNTCSGGIVHSTISLKGFTPAVPVPVISPNSNDPRVHTTNPLTELPPQDANGVAGFEAPFTWRTLSLLDVGTYHYRWECTYTLDGRTELPCPNNGTANADFDLVVFNNPPTSTLSFSGTPAVHGTITLSARSSDPDGGTLAHAWRVVSPAGHAAVFSAPNAATTTLSFVDERDIGPWRVEVDVDDDEGERKTFSISFTVPNLPPSVSIVGANRIDALQTVLLKSSTTVDPDGGPPLELRWNILEAPPTASVTAPYPDYRSAAPCPSGDLCIPTTDRDIGRWKIELVATDNEGASDSKTIEVVVANLPPKITLSTANRLFIKAGDSVVVSNTTPNDPDGGTVTHEWELIQVPVAAGVAPTPVFRTGSTLSLVTPVAGTWILKLHAVDNDSSPDSEVKQELTIFVDGPVTARISGLENASLALPLVLDGSGSVDADAPCTPQDPACGHLTSAGAVREVSGIVSYNWTLLEVPREYADYFWPGPVDYSVGAANGSSSLTVPANALRPGSWTYELEVVDNEGNRHSTTHRVNVLPANTLPEVVAVSTGHVLTDVSGLLTTAVGASAAASFDPDNLVLAPYSPGLGITAYEWRYLRVPPGCASLPTPPTGATASTFVLYSPGSIVPLLCQGQYLLGVAVTDDEAPPNALTNFRSVPLSIGNCPSAICIDYPTTANFKYLQLNENADALIYYHLNAALYADPALAQGVRLELALFHESDTSLVNPVYTGQYDYDVLAAALGGYAVAHWSGHTNAGTRAPPGKYTVRIRAAQPLQSSVRFEAIETAAIWVDSVDVLVAPSSGSLLSLDPGAPGLESVRIDYTVSSTFTASPPYDEAQLLVRRNDGARTLLGTVPIPTPRSGTFLWSGELSTAGTRVTPGEYTVEVEVLQAGRSLGTSARHAVSAYRIQLALKPLCIDDATNATTGIFVPRTPPLPLPLDRLKFLTAPVTVEAKSIVGTATKVVLELDSGDPGSIGVFNARTGAVESLPKTWLGADFDAAQRLEVKLLAQGVASGTTVLRVRYEANGTTIGERKLKLRVNDMPGIAGVPVVADPKFLYGRVFNQGDTIRAAIDPLIFVDRAGRKATAHVVRHKTPAQWAMDNTIVPLASKEVTITAGNISVADLGNALAANDLELPDDKGYDIVYDFGTCPADPAAYAGDLRLDPGDIVDSILPDRPSVTVLPNLLAAGKYGVGSADFGTGASPATTKVPKGFDMLDVPVDFDFRLRGQLHFPDPMPAGKLPLVVIAHGNHAPLQFPMMPRTSPNLTSNENYLGYEYLQRHLASHGYITASIDLDQMYGDPPLPIINGSGIQLRAYVLLRNIEELLKNASIAGGKLVGAIDPQRVYLVGHSRGGEAVVVAQEMYASNTDNPAAPSPRPIGSASFDAGIGIKGIVSVSPVSVHAVALPSAMPYLLLYGSADGDVNGFTPGVQPFVHYDRARGAASLVYALGANHNYFNDSWAYSDANQDVTCTAIDMCTIVAKPVLPGTNLNPFSRAQQRDLLRAYTLAFLDRHDKTGFLPYEAYLNNPPELLRPLGIPAAVPLTAAWKALPGVARQVMDDYESNPNVLLASSGAAVAPTVANIAEAPLTSSTAATQRFYQATQGVVFDWASSAGYKFVPTAPIDFRGAALSFRIAQQPLAAQTILLNGPLTLGVRVSDGVNSSAVTLAAWGAAGSVYPSSAYVPGLTLTTKAAFETRVVPWWAFSANGSAVDLNHITEISFEFGGIATSPTGRIAIDDVEVLR